MKETFKKIGRVVGGAVIIALISWLVYSVVNGLM